VSTAYVFSLKTYVSSIERLAGGAVIPTHYISSEQTRRRAPVYVLDRRSGIFFARWSSSAVPCAVTASGFQIAQLYVNIFGFSDRLAELYSQLQGHFNRNAQDRFQYLVFLLSTTGFVLTFRVMIVRRPAAVAGCRSTAMLLTSRRTVGFPGQLTQLVEVLRALLDTGAFNQHMPHGETVEQFYVGMSYPSRKKRVL